MITISGGSGDSEQASRAVFKRTNEILNGHKLNERQSESERKRHSETDSVRVTEREGERGGESGRER